MTQFEEPIKVQPIIITNAVLYLSDLEVELSDSDDSSVYTELCFTDDLDFDPYFENSDDSDDSDDAKIFPSDK